jgi:N-succinyldiaminopimelate aminotransferase
MRSGYAAGDADIMKRFTLYRTYHGSAMSPSIQLASLAAWQDEVHVIENRRQYREKFVAFRDILTDVLPLEIPEAGFYYWAKTPMDDQAFVQKLFAEYNVTVLPGSLLARDAHGANPGRGHVRIALVGSLSETCEAAERIRSCLISLR